MWTPKTIERKPKGVRKPSKRRSIRETRRENYRFSSHCERLDRSSCSISVSNLIHNYSRRRKWSIRSTRWRIRSKRSLFYSSLLLFSLLPKRFSSREETDRDYQWRYLTRHQSSTLDCIAGLPIHPPLNNKPEMNINSKSIGLTVEQRLKNVNRKKDTRTIQIEPTEDEKKQSKVS